MDKRAFTCGDGQVFQDPADKRITVMWEKGDPASAATDPVHQGFYFKYQLRGSGKNGAIRIPGENNPYPDSGYNGTTPDVFGTWPTSGTDVTIEGDGGGGGGE